MRVNRTLLLFLPLLIALTMTAGCGNKNESIETQSHAGMNMTGSKQGQSVAFADVDGDGVNDKLVGAPYAENASGGPGVVLVYAGTSSGYSSMPSLILKGDDNFGYASLNLGDVDGDGKDDFAVSAIHGNGEDVSLCGSVTIYKGGGNGKVIIKKLSGEWPMDKFGLSMAAGDLNGDGINDLVVGAPFNTNNPSLYQEGALYVFFGPDFAPGPKLYASSQRKGLGWAIATGRVNNSDTIADLVVGATGTVLVFNGGTGFSPDIAPPDVTFTSSASAFGRSLAVVGDLNNDNFGEIAIGAPKAQVSLNGVSSKDVGSVYIVSSATGTLINVDAFPAPANLLARMDGESLFSRFGSSLAALGDLDSDGKPDFAVSAPMKDVDWNILSGTVYRFSGASVALGTGSAWTNALQFKGVVKDQAYGASLAAAVVSSQTGTINALLIGAPRSNADTGGSHMVNAATGQAVAGGSSGGSSGGSGDCH